VITLAVSAWVVGLPVAAAQQRQMPPAWPYAQTQLPPGEIPPQVAAPRTPPVTPATANPATPPPPLLQAKGSSLQFTQQQVSNSYAPADWFPDSHPRMPEIVAHGKPGVARGCGLCHLPDGRGRPENAPLQGLPEAYIVQQLRDFQQGLRHSADPRKGEHARDGEHREDDDRGRDQGSGNDLARQMYDMKLGTRKGARTALMMLVLANLTDADIVDLVAYLSSREP
jgi:cytochrome c553